MAKKYLTLEEAAETSGFSVDDLKRFRESGDLRGFADRGTWKFREEDIAELQRRQNDSSPDVPLMDEDFGEGLSVLDSDEEVVSEQPTEIRLESDDENVELSMDDSDSDVRLMLDDSMVLGADDSSPEVPAADSDSDVKLVDTDSDSDVRLATEPLLDDSSDSDVTLIADGSDSDVQLLAGDDDRSDSDVALVASDESGLPVVFSDTDQDQPMLLEDSSIELKGDSEIVAVDSSISLDNGNDSEIALVADDSGITLENPADSGILLSDDNGYDLSGADESGISLELDEEEGEDRSGTVPMLEIPSLDEDLDETQFEIPALDTDAESDFDLSMDDEVEGGSDANALFFDDDESGDDSQTLYQETEHGEADDFFDDEYGDDDLQTLEAEVVGTHDDMDVFDAEDEDFEDSFVTGESHAGFAAPAAAGQVAASAESEWGVPAFVGLVFSTTLLALCCMVMFDLVRSIWGWHDPNPLSSMLLDILSF